MRLQHLFEYLEETHILIYSSQIQWVNETYRFQKVKYSSNTLRQRSPTFLAPGTGFMEDIFSTDRDSGEADRLGMIQT